MKKNAPSRGGQASRTSKRVHLKIRFRLSGRDQFGNQFEDFVETKDIGTSGGSLYIKREVRVGSTLKLIGPKGFVALIRAVWSKTEGKGSRRLLGFQLLEPREDWILQFQTR
ncbi:MAG: hypothetical protein U0V70_01610 [Terriglobia bacterium]